MKQINFQIFHEFGGVRDIPAAIPALDVTRQNVCPAHPLLPYHLYISNALRSLPLQFDASLRTDLNLNNFAFWTNHRSVAAIDTYLI